MRILFFCSLPVLITLLTAFFQEGFSQSGIPELEPLLEQAARDKDNGKASYYCYEIAKRYGEEGQPAKALEYLERCVSYGKKEEDQVLMYLAYDRMGVLYTDAKNYNKALDNFQRAERIARQLKRPEFIQESLIHVATSYAASGKHKRSIAPLEEALAIAVQQKDQLLQQQCYELLAAYHNKLGNKTRSAEYTTLYNALVKSEEYKEQNTQQLDELKQKIEAAGLEKKTAHSRLERQTQKLRLAEDSLLATRYSLLETEQSLQEMAAISEKRQLEIDLLNKDKELAGMKIREQEAHIKNEALVINSLIAGTILSVALVAVAVTGYRRKLKANKKINQQNRSIKSSINYAQRIQEAMLPKKDQLDNLVPDSFVLFKPRDSVSGDFYWFSEIKSWYNPDVVFAAVDCTGHGIPGALMSMIGINSLNAIISRGIAESNQILDTLDTEIRTALQQEKTGNNDGMDIALCIFRKEKSILEFSGAKNPLVYIQNNELFQIKGDVHSIGGSRTRKEFSFKKHLVPINQSTMIYLFSDGYRDQFGGKEGNKFMSKRFNQLLFDIHRKPMEEQMKILNQTIEEWRGEEDQTDDILVMGIRLEESI